jgi:hypothetical protein
MTIANAPLKQPKAQWGVSPADVFRWRQDNRVFEQIEAGQRGSEPNAMTGAGLPERVAVREVTPGLFPMLGITPVLGGIPSEKELAGKTIQLALLSYEFWQRHFAGDPRILGRRFFVDNPAAEVVGVLHRGFDLSGDLPTDIYELVAMDGYSPSANGRFLMGFGKLKAGTTIRQAQTSMDVLARDLEQGYPDTNKGLGIRVRTLRDGLFGWSGQVLYPLLAAVALVLLIACTNIGQSSAFSRIGHIKTLVVHLP